MGGEDDAAPLFETRTKSRLWYKMYAGSVLAGVCMICVYRATHIPDEWRWAWLGMFITELWFGIYWIFTQSVRWNSVYRRTFKERLTHRYEDKLPGVDIFVCTADPVIEPPTMVINTVLSLMAYNYPTEKLSVYLSDDGGSELTFYALLEASSFSKSWIPFCKKFKVEPRSPAAFFTEESKPDGGQKSDEWLRIKNMYKEMENRINIMMKDGRVSQYVHRQHKCFSNWEMGSTSCDHQAIVQIIIDGKEETALDDEGFRLPTLVYMAREKRPHHHHNFKAGAMNSLLRVSSEISNGAVILNVDCDMYSNDSETVRDAMCFFMDEKGNEVAYVQLPQYFNNITKNDIYANSLKLVNEVDFHSLDGYGGSLYIGSGCFHRRESTSGKKYSECSQEELKALTRKNVEETASALEERAKWLITCNYEDNTEWGNETGVRYGCPVEDVITGLSIKCNGWKAIYFDPPRMGFLGVAPVTLVDRLVEQKRWWEGAFQILLSKYCPFIYGHGRIKLGLQMGYTIYCIWPPCCWPVLYYVVVPSLSLLSGNALYPNVSSLWFAVFAYVIISTTIYNLWEFLSNGYTLKGWWNDKRMWMFKRIASYPFAFLDSILRLAGINQSPFIITPKVADEDVLKRYEQEIMDFGSPSPMFTIIASIAMVNFLCLLGGLKRLLLDEERNDLCSFLLQYLICASLVLISSPVYTAMFIRRDNGRMPLSITIKSVALSIIAYVFFIN